MLGSRDSEVAVLIEDTELVVNKMNGEFIEVGKFSHSLRCHLFMYAQQFVHIIDCINNKLVNILLYPLLYIIGNILDC